MGAVWPFDFLDFFLPLRWPGANRVVLSAACVIATRAARGLFSSSSSSSSSSASLKDEVETRRFLDGG